MGRVYRIIHPDRPSATPLREQLASSLARDLPDVTEAMSLCAAELDRAASDIDREARRPGEAITGAKLAVAQLLLCISSYQDGEAR